jgi:serine protease Do
VAVIVLCLVLAIALSVGEILHPTDVSPEPDSAQTPNDTEKLPSDTQSDVGLTASQLYDRYRQASVTVVAVDGDGKKYLSGTAVFGDGYVATVYSGISKAQRVEVIDSDGKTYAATVVGGDATVDLALLKTDAELKDVRATDKTSFEAGKRLYAIGTVGEAQFGGSLFEGVVAYGERVLELSASDGEIRRAVAVQIGGINSSELCGSPVFDEYGRAVAMVWSGTDDASVGLALPLDRVVAVLEFFKDGEQPTAEVLSSIAYSAPTLGVIGENTSVGELCGVLITDFTDGMCDAAVKLRRGDIIVKIDDTVTGDSISIKEAIYTCTPGDTVEVHVLRDGQRLSFFVKLK